MINLTGPPPHSTLDMVLPGSTEVAFHCRARGLSFAREDAEQTLAAIDAKQTARCLLPWIPLMQGGDRGETVVKWKELAEREPERQLRLAYAGLALVFADLADCLTLWKRELEGGSMKESRIVEEWREEGRQEGRTETLHSVLLRLLHKRFPSVSSPEVIAAVQRQTDADELMRWLDLIAGAESLEAFRTAINA